MYEELLRTMRGAHWARTRERIMEKKMNPALIGLRQMAQHVGMSESSFRKLVLRNEVPYVKPAGSYLFDPKDVIDSLKKTKGMNYAKSNE